MRLPGIACIGLLGLTGCEGFKVEVLNTVVNQDYTCGVTADYRNEEDRRFDTPVLYVAAKRTGSNQTKFDEVTGHYDISSSKIDIIGAYPRIVDEEHENSARDVVRNCAAAATSGTHLDINKKAKQ